MSLLVDVISHNRLAWNWAAANGNRWFIPVTAEDIARARAGEVQVVLTPGVRP